MYCWQKRKKYLLVCRGRITFVIPNNAGSEENAALLCRPHTEAQLLGPQPAQAVPGDSWGCVQRMVLLAASASNVPWMAREWERSGTSGAVWVDAR